MDETTTIIVKGMTCGHCVASVQEEVGAIDGVTGVDVDLGSGRVVVSSTRPLGADELAAAVAEAGYEVA